MVIAGRELAAVKSELPHGQWGLYLRDELGISSSSAAALINVAELAEELGEKFASVANLPARALYLLAAPSTPADIIDSVVNGTIPPTEEAIIHARKGNSSGDHEPTRLDSLQFDNERLQDENARLRSALAETRTAVGIRKSITALPEQQTLSLLEQSAMELADRATQPSTLAVQQADVLGFVTGFLKSPDEKRRRAISRVFVYWAQAILPILAQSGAAAQEVGQIARQTLKPEEIEQAATALAQAGAYLSAVANAALRG
jgi:hypothetical protein